MCPHLSYLGLLLILLWFMHLPKAQISSINTDCTPKVTPHMCSFYQQYCNSTIVVFGGSVTAGHQCKTKSNTPDKECAWPSRLEKRLRSHWKCVKSCSGTRVINHACGGCDVQVATREFLEQVTSWNLHQQQHMVILATTTNDDNLKKFHANSTTVLMANVETFVRTVVKYDIPLLLFEDFGHHWKTIPQAEIAHLLVARVYGIPVVSAREAYYEPWQKGWKKVGFNGKNNVHVQEYWHEKFALLLDLYFIEVLSSFCREKRYDFVQIEPQYGGSDITCVNVLKAFVAPQEKGEILKNEWDMQDVTGFIYMADVGYKNGYISGVGKEGSCVFTTEVPVGHYTLSLTILKSFPPIYGNVSVEVKSSTLIRTWTISTQWSSPTSELVPVYLEGIKVIQEGSLVVSLHSDADHKVKVTGLDLIQC